MVVADRAWRQFWGGFCAFSSRRIQRMAGASLAGKAAESACVLKRETLLKTGTGAHSFSGISALVFGTPGPQLPSHQSVILGPALLYPQRRVFSLFGGRVSGLRPAMTTRAIALTARDANSGWIARRFRSAPRPGFEPLPVGLNVPGNTVWPKLNRRWRSLATKPILGHSIFEKAKLAHLVEPGKMLHCAVSLALFCVC